MAKNSDKDKAMAKHLKELGVKREIARCPICNAVVNIKAMQNHVSYHS